MIGKTSRAKPPKTQTSGKSFSRSGENRRFESISFGAKGKNRQSLNRLTKQPRKPPLSLGRQIAVSRSKSGQGTSSSLYPAKQQVTVIRVYRSGIVGRAAHKITFEEYDTSKQAFG